MALFSSATLHTVNTRPTTATRKTLQVYYGHASRPAMSHDYDSLMPPQFFRCVSFGPLRAVESSLKTPAPVGPQRLARPAHPRLLRQPERTDAGLFGEGEGADRGGAAGERTGV